MTQPTASLALTEQQLADIAAKIATYRQHAPTGFACCTAHPVADAGAALLAEVHRLKGQRKYLIGQLAKRDAESGRGDEALREFLAGDAEPGETPTP
jgi:hypothetical protein